MGSLEIAQVQKSAQNTDSARLPDLKERVSPNPEVTPNISAFGSANSQYILVNEHSGATTLQTVHGKSAKVTPNVEDGKITSISVMFDPFDHPHFSPASAPVTVYQGLGDLNVQIIGDAADPINNLMYGDRNRSFDLQEETWGPFSTDKPCSRVTVNLSGWEISDSARERLNQKPFQGNYADKEQLVEGLARDIFNVSVTFVTAKDAKLWSDLTTELNGLGLGFAVMQLPDGGVQLNPAGKVYFAHNSAGLIPEAKEALDLLSRFIVEKGLSVSCVGYASIPGSDSHNQTLSLDRAQTVGEYLHAKGVENGKITYQAYGKEQAGSDVQADRQVSIILGYGN